ncbi:P-loop containing nucleoside triphosphate hydrolase protein [Pavlovales sp. CCMP2436]|nr:P-loop containing nucleoside triphosphate hydrolase protein [Pavlovales sp. CCMP2436]
MAGSYRSPVSMAAFAGLLLASIALSHGAGRREARVGIVQSRSSLVLSSRLRGGDEPAAADAGLRPGQMQVKIGEAEGEEAAEHSIVFVNPATLSELKVSAGGVLLFRGLRNRRTVAMAMPRDSVPVGEVLMPTAVRANLRASSGDVISVHKAQLEGGQRVLVVPFADTLPEGLRKAAEEAAEAAAEEGKAAEGMDAKADDKAKDGKAEAPKVKKAKKAKAGAAEGAMAGGEEVTDLFEQCIKPFFLDQERPVHKGETFIVNGVQFKVKATDPDPCVIVTDSTEIVCDDGEPLDRAEEARIEGGQVTYADVGGCGKAIKQLREIVELPLRHPTVFKKVGVRPPRGVLLHGPPGCGKTLLAKAVATEAGVTMRVLHGPEIASAKPGEAEGMLRKAFDEAAKSAPSIIFIDELDALAPKRDKQQGEGGKRIVSQLLTLMDNMSPSVPMIVLAATNRPSTLDEALRRFGRFDREIDMSAPDTPGRLEIIKIHMASMKLHETVDINQVAEDTQGFCGADIAQLATDAAMECVRETTIRDVDLEADEVPLEVLKAMSVLPKHIDLALSRIQPSSLRDKAAEVPSDVTWADVGGLEFVKRELMETIQFPIRYESKFGKFGMSASKGVLMYGPSGCGKTLMAKAVANECQSNFISVKGPELLSMWFGQSESNVRELFDKARAASPCILFFDEIDSIAKPRGSSSGGGEAGDRIVNQILTEIDGVGATKNVFVLGATNRPDMLDPAVTRPGRLDQLIYVPLPDHASRMAILHSNTRKSPMAKDVSLNEIADRTEGFSGADLTEVCQRACKLAIREDIEKANAGEVLVDAERFISRAHFEDALEAARQSVSSEELKKFKLYRQAQGIGSAI